MIVDFANLNTTTPFDVECSLGLGGMTNPMFPACTPTSVDELLFRFSTAGYYWQGPGYPWNNIIYEGGTSGVEAVVDPLANAGAETVTGAGVTGAFASVTLGLHAATMPTHTTSNADVNQAAYEVFTSSLPLNTGGWMMP